MIVVDASALVELFIEKSSLGSSIRRALRDDPAWVMPSHGILEAANALRGLWLGRHSSDASFEKHLSMLQKVHVSLFPPAPLIPRIRELAANATPYDAAYIALAETLSAPLVTVDKKFAGVPGIRADVRVIMADGGG